jgi:hypothetical protein
VTRQTGSPAAAGEPDRWGRPSRGLLGWGGAGLAGFVEQKNLIDDTTVKKALGEFQDDLGG